MALCLAESLIVRRGFDPADQMERYVRWLRSGHLSSTGTCFDVGSTVHQALAQFESTREPLCGSTDPYSAGNGSIMRLAPVPLAFAGDARAALTQAAMSSRTTHGARAAVDGCRYLATLIVGAVAGAAKDELLSARYCPLPGYWQESPLAPEVDEIAAGSFKRLDPPQIRGTGYVVRSLEAALWAFHRTESFEAGCLAAANLGDDADTTAAVYGQLAGAHYGAGDIPQTWRALVAHHDLIERFADQLLDLRDELDRRRSGMSMILRSA
jgi:ADP-ribosylglycohydrolase